MAKPAWLRARTGQAPLLKKEREQSVIAATGRALATLDARLAEHGEDGLAAWLRANLAGEPATTRVCVMQRIMRAGVGGDDLKLCRSVMS